MLAALINALKIVGKKMEDIKVVVNGIGAAGVACSKIVMAAGVKNIVGCDTTGAIYEGREENMNWVKDWYARNTNPDKEKGDIHEVIKGADVFFGLSAPGVITTETTSPTWRRTRSSSRWQIRFPRSCPKTPPDTSR